VVMDGQPWLYGTCPSRDFACVFRPWLLPATACHRLPPPARPACPTSHCLRTPPPGPARLRILSLPFSPSGWFQPLRQGALSAALAQRLSAVAATARGVLTRQDGLMMLPAGGPARPGSACAGPIARGPC
jgi:hypothetical protein